MGCVGSKEKKKPRLPMQEFEMDSHEDSEHGGSTAEDVISEKWRHTPHKALNQFLRESSNESLFSGDLFDYFQDDEFVELRTLLDEPLGRSHFLAHVAHYSQDDVNLVRVWLLLHQYHHMESNDSERYEAAKNLYKHYFQISQERKQAAEAFKAEKIEAGEFETDENRDSADDGEDDGDDGSGSRSSSKLSRKKSNASESGSVCSIPPVESAKNQYQRKLVPEECSNFPIKVVKVISSLRPTVELALIDAHEKFSGNGGKKLSSNLQSNNNNNETNGNLPPSSPSSSSSSSSPMAKKDNSSSHDNDSATGSPNSNPSKIVQMVNNDLSTEDRVVAVRKYSSSLGQLVDIAPDGGIGVSEVKLNGSNLIANKLDSKTLPNNIDRVPPLYLFIDLQNEVFKEMRPLYLHFKETSEDYEAFQKSKKLWYNHVEADDFTYIDKLGAGGFGNVVHVIRKSTGKHYAMKVQAKDTLVTTWSGKIQHVEIERDVLVANRKFDFIVSLRYAFQSDRYAFLVLDLAENGSLRQLLEDSPGFQLELPQVRLYVAEIVLALECLHDHEIIYRDLKPENVLLCADGHIMLADMGLAGFYYQDKYHEDDYAEFGIQHKSALEAQEEDDSLFEDSDVETDGDKDTSGGGTASGETATSDDATAAASSAGMTTSSTKTTDGNDDDDDDDDDSECRPDKIKRVKTIKSHDTDCGTPLYRAPEMIAAEKNNGHYNEGVDWFMLGVFTFECLVGHLPFEPKTKGITDSGMIEIETDEQELRLLRRKVIIPPHLGDATKDLLTGLLDLNPETRLGAGPSDLNRDMEALKGHRFFVPLAGPLATELDWEKVSKKEYAPLYVPKPKELNEKPKYSSFESLVKDWRKTAKREAKQYAKRRNIKTNYNIQALTEGQALDAESEKYFDNWDYIDPETINLEKVAEQERKEEDAAPGRLKSIRRDLGLSIRGKINKKKKKKKK